MLENDKTLIQDDDFSGANDPCEITTGTVLAGRYRISDLLGEGGMGQVFKAEDLKLKQTVALKFLPEKAASDPAYLRAFHEEVRVARQISHANVCRVFDIGEAGGRHFISMEFIEGDDLSSLLRRIGRLPSDKALEIARQLCYGLAAIHDAGILHRDLKPANVIIDSRGRARITDFGIAGLEKELKEKDARVGTPAYMSPEQVTGEGVTQKSDLYSLGLLLYEIFTGKQAFEADSVLEVLQKQRAAKPVNPTEIQKDIDLLVEKTILACIEKDPAARPKSALQVAMMMPGGNPLEAAILAGETPSPEMVAAAPKEGALKPAVAVALLAGVVGVFAFLLYFSYPVKQHRWLPIEKSPEVLADRARSMAQKFGYIYAPVDVAYSFADDRSYGGYVRQKSKTEPADSWVNAPDRWERLATGQPDEIHFWYRQSPRYFSRFGAVDLDYFNPSPLETAGMVRLDLDVRGRLMELTAVPPQVEKSGVSPVRADWAALFAEAGLDIKNYTPAESQWTPGTYSDERVAWTGPHVDHPDIPVRIEGAAYQGRAVYFKVVMPWDEPYRDQEDTLYFTPSVMTGVAVAGTLLVCVLVAGAMVARRNIKLQRADTKGAAKLFLFVFGGLLIARLLRAHLNSSVFIFRVVFECIQYALAIAVATWISYVAVEPFIRRYWPNLSISWSRLMAGDLRDPLVGRDILIGGFFGLLHVVWLYIVNLLPGWSNGRSETVLTSATLPLIGLRGITALLAESVSMPVFYMSLFLLLVVILTLLFRRLLLTAGAFWAMQALIILLVFSIYSPAAAWLSAIVIAGLTTVTLMRFGMLAFLSYLICFRFGWSLPLTTDPSAWYFNATVVSTIAIVGIAVFGFYTSLAGRSPFRRSLEPAAELS